MVAPIDVYNAMMDDLRTAFEGAAPNIPLCEARVKNLFGSLNHTHSDGDDGLYLIAMLAHDMGLEISFKVIKQ